MHVPVASRASQLSGDAAIGRLEGLLPVVSSRASPDSLDALSLRLDIANLDAPVSSRATQTSVDTANTTLLHLDTPVTTRASQVSLDLVQASVNDLEPKVMARSTQTSVDSLATSLTAHDTTASEAFDQALRAQIERQLAEGTTRVSLFYLPNAFDGVLEFVRDIVADVIAQNQAAGIPVGNATAIWTEGNTAFGQQNFIRAYDKYALAYREVVKGKVK